ncbi:MAG: GNAT family N-acetyltransferase [Spirochaetes bacterium]|nr:GNAT family N-acetyltransferase [Spirochaetota bacterium]
MNQHIPLQIPKLFKFQNENNGTISKRRKTITDKDTKIRKNVLYKYQILHKPGTYMSDPEIKKLVHEIREVAATAFNPIPEYQAMCGTREELSDKVIALAWDKNTLAGFASTVELYIPGIGNILHLGLTVVRPEHRSNGLTHLLMQKAITSYILKHAIYFDKLWITNCAAVLSSLVNVALHFEQVYPSPKNVTYTAQHKIIAETINVLYRNKLYIRHDSIFDEKNHIFKGSIKGTVFQKDANDTSYYHRNSTYNNYYKNLMDFKNGDEVLQVGYASIPAAIRHAIFNQMKKFIPQ